MKPQYIFYEEQCYFTFKKTPLILSSSCVLLLSLGEVNKTRTGGYDNRSDMLQEQESNGPEKQDQHESEHANDLQSSLYTSGSLSSGLNSNRYTNASKLLKTETTQYQPQNVHVPVSGKQTHYRLERTYLNNAHSGWNQNELTSSRFHIKLYIIGSEMYTLLQNI